MTETTICDKYMEITSLGKWHGVWLVLDRDNKKVFVKKRRTDFNVSVYQNIKQIHNPHIPQIVSCEETEGVLNIIEEYITGETLLERMEHGDLFSEKEIIEIMIQLCDGVECLHKQPVPIIHRDIKPSNIMISSDGIVKLIDYNTARHYEPGILRDTKYMGTPGYAAPEQYGFSQSDVRTDIYAIGIVLNYMLTGCHASEKIGRGRLGEVVKKCIHIDPDRRYQHVSEVRTALNIYAPKQRCSKRGFWPIPGFRTGELWKMFTAVAGYCSICSMAIDTRELQNKIPILWAVESISKMIVLLFVVAMATDYMGIRKRLILANHEIRIVRWIGYAAWGFVAMFIIVGINMVLEEIVLLLI